MNTQVERDNYRSVCPAIDMADIEPLITLPTVSADGAAVNGDARDFTGELVSERNGGTYTVLRHSRELLLASDPLPPRLLLTYATKTRRERRKEAQAEATVYAFFAVLPVTYVLNAMGFSGYLIAVTMAGIMAWAYRKVASDPKKVWQTTEWLDFEERTWCSRRSFANRELPPVTETFALGELAIFCFTRHWEQGVIYDVGLGKITDLRFPELGDVIPLNILYSCDAEAEARHFARSLAAFWGIQCWK